MLSCCRSSNTAQSTTAALTLVRLSWMPASPSASCNALSGTVDSLRDISQSEYAPWLEQPTGCFSPNDACGQGHVWPTFKLAGRRKIIVVGASNQPEQRCIGLEVSSSDSLCCSPPYI